MGLHGEPGASTQKMQSANGIVKQVRAMFLLTPSCDWLRCDDCVQQAVLSLTLVCNGATSVSAHATYTATRL